MIIPLVAGIVLIGSATFAAKKYRTRVTPPKPSRPHPIEQFLSSLRSGARPSAGQYQSALLSALVSRRIHTARNIAAHYDTQYHGEDPIALGLLRWAMANGRTDLVAIIHGAFPEVATEADDTQYHDDLPHPDSPQWIKLLATLQTEHPDYNGPNHVGAFEHHRRRLARYCDPSTVLGDLNLQRDLITRDLHRLYAENQAITDYVGTDVELPGGTTLATASGVLALLKCAGPRGAMNWLTIPRERSEFPTTTALFVACNAIF